ncbi:MAG: universal stress protein [Acidimicrobiales bacterium]|nr:universal stress protein [Acidimicrobiales bacterium]
MATVPSTQPTDVVVAVDGSESSQAALRWAAGLGLPLRVVQTWEYPSTIPLPWSRLTSHTPEEVDQEVESALRELVSSSLPDGIPVTSEVLRGPAATALINHAAETRPRMLVVGSRGHGGFAGLRLGSVSRHCLEHAPCPVVMVPGPERTTAESTLSSIAVGVDDSELSKRALDLAIGLAGDTGASVTTIHVFDIERAHLPADVTLSIRSAVDEQMAAQREEALSRHEVSEALIVDGDPRRMLPDTAAEHHADLLVVGALGAGTVNKDLGPVASYLASHTTIPLAVVR